MRFFDEQVLVTGAAGFIGSHVVERLLLSGARVVGVDNFDPFYSRGEKLVNLTTARAHPAFRLEEVDCADLSALERALHGVPITSVIHLAAKAGVRPSVADPVAYANANVVATQAVLEFARRRGIRRVIFGSSSSVYGDAAGGPFAEEIDTSRPVSPYAATKRAAELLCAAHAHLHGAAILALRFFTVYGPRQRPDLAIRRFATSILAHETILLHGDGSSSRDYTWIDDIVEGVLASLARSRTPGTGFEIFNLGGSRPTSLLRLVRLIEAATGEKAIVEHVPPQPGDVTHTCADIAKARLLLDYRARTPIEEGIPRFVAWLRSRHRRRITSPGPVLTAQIADAAQR